MTQQQAVAVVAQEQDALVDVGLSEHFKITPTGLQVIGRPDFNACQALWNKLLTMEKVIQFAIGDAAKYIREHFGHDADQIISDRTGWTLETIRNYEWVADKVPKPIRRLDRLSFTHHQKLAGQPTDVQRKWLDRAADDEEGPWTVARLDAALKANGDVAPSAFFILVRCDSETKRNKLQAQLESEGYICTATERRGGKE